MAKCFIIVFSPRVELCDANCRHIRLFLHRRCLHDIHKSFVAVHVGSEKSRDGDDDDTGFGRQRVETKLTP